MMSEQYVQVEVRLEQMKSLGEDAEKEGVHSEEQAPPASSPGASDPPSVSVACGNASRSSVHGHKSRGGRMGKDRNTCGSSDPSIYGSLVHAKKNVNRAELERTLQIKGSGKILQGKLETNGNYVNNQASKNNQDSRREEALKLARKRRPVTVDTAKAKTSLEALKLSIKQLKWKEVRCTLDCSAEMLPAHMLCKFYFCVASARSWHQQVRTVGSLQSAAWRTAFKRKKSKFLGKDL